MPRNLKKTAANPENGMLQTAQLAARAGVWVSKGVLIVTHPISYRRRVYVKTEWTRPASEVTVQQIRLLADHC